MSTPNNEFSVNLGVRLRRARGYRSQAEFARFLGIKNQQTYARYETGERLPNAKVLHQMAQALGVEIGALVHDSRVPSSSEAAKESAGPYEGHRSLPKLIRELSEMTGVEEEKIRAAVGELLRRGS